MGLAPSCPDISVSYILAIESDPRQAAALSHVVKDRVPGAQLTVVDSKDGALASIQKKAPDLILVTALFSPREEEELIAHLRTLEGAEHLQTLTIPLLAASDDGDGRSKRGLFGFKKKKKTDDVPTQGCDPVVFAEQVAGYLKTAAEMKANAEAAKIAAQRAAQRASETAAETAAAQPVEAVADTPSETVFTTPSEPAIAPEPEPAVAYAAEQKHATAPESFVAPAPEPEPPVAPVREHPLVGYSVNSLGELLSKEQAVESSARPDPSSAAEPQIFGSVLFAKVKPKREIKPFSEAPPVSDDRPVVPDLPIIDETPIVADSPVVAQPVEAVPPPALEPPTYIEPPAYVAPPQYVEPAFEAPVAVASVEHARVYEPQPAFEPPVVVEAPRPIVPIPVPEPQAMPEPARPVRLVQRLPPLAMWARRLQEIEAIHPRDNGVSSNGHSEEGPLAVLRIPPSIATITYPTGCRIRRVTAKSVA
jgi:hypothetical protein